MTDQATDAGKNTQDYLGMSDEDFLKVNEPPASVASGAEQQDQGASTPGSADEETGKNSEEQSENTDAADAGADENTNSDADAAATGSDADVGKKEDTAGADKTAKDADGKNATAADTGKTVDPAAAKPDAAAAAGEKKDGDKAKEAAKSVDFEAFYKQIVETPFKANGREFKINSPEEAIRLMQMGAGYGRKIQELQPALKTIRMLEKANLLDESKLSFLIDINNKNPDAIKKLIKDSGIDPLDLNTGDNVNYIPNNHSVSDNEFEFKDVLGDIQRHPTGKETLSEINLKWDKESKDLLFKEPQVLKVIQAQRDTGIYDQIAAEIERRKLLGEIPFSTPFLHAYRDVGKFMQDNNLLRLPEGQSQTIQTQTGGTQQTQPIATSVQAPKAQVANGDKAAAAAPTKSVPTRKPAATVNPLAMPDDEFMKQFAGRF